MEDYQKLDGDKSNLSNVLASVRGNTNFIISIKYLRYNPKKKFQLPTALKIYKSFFRNEE